MKEFMSTYIGQKIVNAMPMTRGEYNQFRGWTLPEDEDPIDEGMLVEYEPAPENFSNVPGFEGYISWSPRNVFDKAYTSVENMGFDGALKMLERGKKLARAGWNGADMFIFLVPGSHFEVNRAPLLGIYPEGTPIDYHAHVDMKTAQGDIVPWICSQTDMLAKDWMVVE